MSEGSFAKSNLEETHKTARVTANIDRPNAELGCRGVGHTARGREVPRELHLTDVRLLYLISPWDEGSSISLLSGARRRGVMCTRPTGNPLQESVSGRQVMKAQQVWIVDSSEPSLRKHGGLPNNTSEVATLIRHETTRSWNLESHPQQSLQHKTRLARPCGLQTCLFN